MNYPVTFKDSWYADALLGYGFQAIDSTGTVILVGQMKRLSVPPEMTIFSDIERTRLLYRISVEPNIGPSRYLVQAPTRIALGNVEGRWGVPWRQTYRIADAGGRTVGLIRRQRFWAVWVGLLGAAALGIAVSVGLFFALLLFRPPLLYGVLALVVLPTLLLGWALRSVARTSYAVEVPEGEKALLLSASRSLAGWRITQNGETPLSPEAEQLVIPAVIAFVFGKAVRRAGMA